MGITDIVLWIVFGLIAGFIAKAVMPGPDTNSTIITIVLGIVGALVGGFIGRAMFGSGAAADTTGMGFSIWGLLLAVVGAVVVLAIYRLATGRSIGA
ncbi:MAG: GlsB/YeaQ/YmgE family stress response membrane protein [Pyrinomonadaceae bacterium]